MQFLLPGTILLAGRNGVQPFSVHGHGGAAALRRECDGADALVIHLKAKGMPSMGLSSTAFAQSPAAGGANLEITG